jgi:hypothetical protein
MKGAAETATAMQRAMKREATIVMEKGEEVREDAG